MRLAAKIDANQNAIVSALRDIPGVTVDVGHNDIIVSRLGVNYWYEIKNPSEIKKDGTLKAGALRPKQEKLRDTWTGHYKVVSTLEEILQDIGVTR